MFISSNFKIIFFRTLILPNFYKHQFGTSELKTIIKAEEKLNIDKIRELISVEPIENGIKMCDSTINIIFNANPNNQVRFVNEINYDTDFRFMAK